MSSPDSSTLTSTEPSTNQQSLHQDHPPPPVPSTHTSAPTSTSLGQGTTSTTLTSTEKPTPQSDAQNYSSSELDGEQMRAPGEGEVADAVTNKAAAGGHAEEAPLEAGMGDKAKLHEEALHARGKRTGKEIEEEGREDWTGKKGGVDVGEALGGRGRGVVLAAEE